MLYIAYGSNLHLGQMAHRCPTATVVGAAEIKGYDLLFRGGRSSAVATIEPLENGSVPVLLWNINGRDEQALDRYEGWPSFYRKELEIVEFEGNPLPAMVYVMNNGHEFGEPSRQYLNTIREGYQQARFDLDYLDRAVEQSAELALEQDLEWKQEFQDDHGFDDGPSLYDMHW